VRRRDPGEFGVAGTNTVVGTVPNYFVARCGERKFKYWTYRVAADYQITPDNMDLCQLLDWRAFGWIRSSRSTTTVPQGEFGTFDAEKVRAVEIGTKNSFFDRRLQVNAAVFYNRYYDNQVQGTQFIATGTNTGVNLATITNSG
jgi:outer membrane receptor protein involved in Fe transport